MFSMPVECLPKDPRTKEPLDLARFVHDMDDGGLLINGPEPASEDAWEVEQGFAEVWWWALSVEILERVNRKRRARGLPGLKLGPVR